MTDHFALLGEPRRPWLDPDVLQARFLALAAEVHPDRVHQAPSSEIQAATARYTALNAASQCLRDTKDRLAHLLALELGGKTADVQSAPAGVMDMFTEVGLLGRGVDEYLGERRKANSPMLKVRVFERGLAWTEKLMNLQGTLRARQEELEAELRALNPAWESAPPAGDPARVAHLPLGRLDEIYRQSSYLARWHAQLQERVIQLSV